MGTSPVSLLDRRGRRGVWWSASGVWGLAPISSCAAAVGGGGDPMGRGDKGGPGAHPPGAAWHGRKHRPGKGLWNFIYLCLSPRKNLVPPGSLSPGADPVFNRTPFLKISKRNVYSGAGGLIILVLVVGLALLERPFWSYPSANFLLEEGANVPKVAILRQGRRPGRGLRVYGRGLALGGIP